MANDGDLQDTSSKHTREKLFGADEVACLETAQRYRQILSGLQRCPEYSSPHYPSYVLTRIALMLYLELTDGA